MAGGTTEPHHERSKERKPIQWPSDLSNGTEADWQTVAILRRLYARDHLDQVLATFGVILFTNELVKIVWGPQALFSAPPDWLARPVDLFGTPYPAYRLAIIGVGLIVAGLTNWCGMARLIALLPWNQNRNCSEQATA